MDRAVGRAPADDRKLAAGLTEGHPLLRDEIGDAVDLGLARVGHLLVVVGLVADVAGSKAFLDAAYAVHQARRSRLDPDAFQGLRIALKGVDPPLGRGASVELDGKGFE